MKNIHTYQLLADVFRYPDKNFRTTLNECNLLLETYYPEAAAEMKAFSDYVAAAQDDELEELFTKTFDVQPICYLDLGYVIFGEDYKRGAFLLHMQEEQQKAGNDCGTDLSDNISNILTLIAKSGPTIFVRELVARMLAPGVEKMIGEFASSKIELKLKVLRKLHKAIITEDLNHGNVYVNTLHALKAVLEADFKKEIADHKSSLQEDFDKNKSFFQKRTNTPQNDHQEKVEEMNLFTNHKLD